MASVQTKRVAIFRSWLLPISETFILDQLKALARWQPLLLGRRSVKDGLDLSNTTTEIVPESPSALIRALRYWLGRPDMNLVRRLQKAKVSLVHVHFGTNAVDIWPSVKAAKLPMLVSLHGNDVTTHKAWWKSGRGGLRRRIYPRRLLAMSKATNVAFVAVSQSIRAAAMEYGIPAEKISVVYTGVDTETFKPTGPALSKRNPRILFVGRLVPKKGPLILIRAFSELKKSLPDAELVILGDGPLRQQAEVLSSELNVKVAFLGAQPRSAVVSELAAAQVLCLPSIRADNGDAEGFGMVLLEAQACGVPVVTSATGGADEGLLDGQTGFRFTGGDAPELAKKLLQILNHEHLDAFSKSAVRFARDSFDIRDQASKLEEIYDSFA